MSQNLKTSSLPFTLHFILRFSCAMCFIGHGAFGIITKSGWLPFFAVTHIEPALAYKLMPLIGLMDIALGISMLIRPMRFVLIWMFIWSIWTALLRPLAGMGCWEFLERAGNYGAPLCFLYLANSSKHYKSIFDKIKFPELENDTIKKLTQLIIVFTALLLIGHGGFGAFQQKEMLINHFRSIGFSFTNIDLRIFITYFGYFEILLALTLLFKPTQKLALFIVFWKVATEALYPISGTPIWEFIERFGSYGLPLALYYLLINNPSKQIET